MTPKCDFSVVTSIPSHPHTTQHVIHKLKEKKRVWKKKEQRLKQGKSQETNRKYQIENILSLISYVNPWAMNRGMTENITMIQMNPYS